MLSNITFNVNMTLSSSGMAIVFRHEQSEDKWVGEGGERGDGGRPREALSKLRSSEKLWISG